MSPRILVLILALLSQPLAATADDADPAGDPVLTALVGELDRSMEQLSLPEAPRPYWMAYTLYDSHQATATGAFGALLHSSVGRSRPLRAEVRVGDYSSDNANFATFGEDPSGLSGASLVIDDDPVAIARDLWIVTDAAYKSAVEGLATKEAARGPDDDETRPPDFTPAAAVVRIDSTPRPAPERGTVETLVRDLSAGMADVDGIVTSRVYATDAAWRRYLVTSEGTRIVDVDRMTVVRAVAEVRAEDGALVKNAASWIVKSPDHLPDPTVMEVSIRNMMSDLKAAAASQAEADYIGPVVFSGQAAAEVFRQLLVPQLMGTPAEEAGDDWSTDSRPLARLGRRVLPPGFEVNDDPAAAPELAGSYIIDDEGIPTERVELVSEGVVQRLLMSRTPREDLAASNGHGRGTPSTRMVGMPGVLEVTADRTMSPEKLRRQAFRLARQAGLDHVLLVRMLDDPAMRTPASVRRIRFDDDGGPALTNPLIVTRLYADGREEPVRNARLWSADQRALRDIVACANGTVTHDYLAPPVQHGGGGWVSGATSGVPITLRAPSMVLVTELEMGRQPGSSGNQPLLPSPLAEAPAP
ncbi:MAG: metallopeptidase TldD-related protein [Myxococcota bacterium]|jgi:hypothetical protein|nr:metallopeptidase TldD-related protein [Myxococcota bacterium]